ncbi:hypothetical protein EDC44_10324 [Cricetibacter osteomyelitidis]|uniref:Uncharacterized protein n=1 Tax=Cricetibacter osteomyelitidis TaxID=1521931 RepID=A0A4R2T1P3_9PAST|nr:hypothetical protein EDC44_10324 [Cricetibacter osteomyelitidis]
MKNVLKTTVLATIIGLSSAGVFAKSIPSEIYQPRGAQLIKSDRQGNGE